MHNVRNEEIIKTFGERLATIRKQKGITQTELAAKAEISQVQIARIEKGRLNTTISTVYSIAQALGMKPSEII